MKAISFLIISIVLISCREMKDVSAIKEAKSISLCYLSEEEYDKDEQIQTKEYLEQRQVLQKIELKEEQRDLFLNEFLNQDNYEALTRKCQFQPVYALLVDNKLYALFDTEYCPTIKYVNKKKEAQFLGITTENTLDKVVKNLIK